MRTRALVLIGIVAALAVAQDPILFRRELKEGSEVTYVTKFNGTSSFETPMGAQDMKTGGETTLILRTGKVDGEKADLELITTNIKVNMEGPMGDQDMSSQMPKEVKAKGKLDHRNRITEVKMEGQAGGMAQMMMAQTGASNYMMSFVEFPEGPLAPGATWEMSLPPIPMMTDAASKLAATFVGEKDGALEVTFKGQIPVNFDSSKMPAGQEAMPMAMTMTGTLDLEGTSRIEKGTGRTLSTVYKMKTNAKMDVQGMTIPLTGTMSSTMEIKK